MLLTLTPAITMAGGKHLFILSGQSNMAGMKPEVSFTPAVTKAFGKENIIVAKSAYSGASIRSWAKSNHEFPPPTRGRVPKVRGHFHETMITVVKAAIKDQSLKTVTFVFCQIDFRQVILAIFESVTSPHRVPFLFCSSCTT